jgi:hypothetical protein
MNLSDGFRTQLEGAYRQMAQRTQYRPLARTDGQGHLLPWQSDLETEAAQYAEHWAKQEVTQKGFWVGCGEYPARSALIFVIEAARLLAATQFSPANITTARRLLRLALAALPREAPALTEGKR